MHKVGAFYRFSAVTMPKLFREGSREAKLKGPDSRISWAIFLRSIRTFSLSDRCYYSKVSASKCFSLSEKEPYFGKLALKTTQLHYDWLSSISRQSSSQEIHSQFSFTTRKSPLVYASASCWKYRYDTQPMLHQPDERLFRFALVFSSHVTTTFSAVQRSLSTGSWHITRKREPFKIRTNFSLIFVWASGVLQSPSK